jgi:DNA-directed RNA polymerase specialized sigma24 family protein
MGNSRNRDRGQKIGSKKTKRYSRIWKKLFVDSYNRLLAYARKLTKNEANALDAVQEVLVQLLVLLPNPSLIMNHGAYMTSIVRNNSLKSTPKQNHAPLHEEIERESGPATEAEILEWLTLNESLLRVVAKDREDPELCLRRIRLMILGYSTKEIAARLSEKESHTRYRLTLFRLALRKAIDNTRGPGM